MILLDRDWLGVSAGMALLAAMRALPGPVGMGRLGLGMFGVPESSSTRFLNDHALSRVGSVAARQPRSHNAYAGNPNSYLNRVRDNGFTSHYDARRRRAPSYQPVGRLVAGGRADRVRPRRRKRRRLRLRRRPRRSCRWRVSSTPP